MCEVGLGLGAWLFADVDACFFSPTNENWYRCWCPFTTCVVPQLHHASLSSNASTSAPTSSLASLLTPSFGGQCQLTTLSLVLIALLLVVWLIVLGMYAYATSELTDMHLDEHSVDAHRHMYRDVLFGVYDASGDGGAHGSTEEMMQAREHSSLLGKGASNGAGGKATNGGTFS